MQGSPGWTVGSIRMYGRYMHLQHAVGMAHARVTAINADVSRITKETGARMP